MSDLAKIKAANNKTLSVLKVLVLAVFWQEQNLYSCFNPSCIFFLSRYQ